MPDSSRQRELGLFLIQILLLVGVGAWIYSPVLRGEWIWDDDLLVASNPSLRSVAGLGRIWFGTPTTDYWPLTWTFLWIEWRLWGNVTTGYHVCSVALEVISGFLLWRVFRRLGLRCAWLGAFLFVIHPLAVESVAWISEIKNTLSLPFYLLAFDAWLDAEEKSTRRWRSVFYYLAAMLCKTSTVMLPLVLMLYCWWKRGRVTREECRWAIPYLAIALVLGVVTIYFQSHGKDHTPVDLGNWSIRLIGAGSACFFYAGKFFLPVNLLPIYPTWSLNPPTFLQVLTLPTLLGLFFGLWMLRKIWARHALFGIGFFVLNLLPVLGLVKMEYLKTSRVADHLTYLPMIGLAGLVAAVCGEMITQSVVPVRWAAMLIVTVVLSAFAWKSHAYVALFAKQETFWAVTVAGNPLSPLPRNNLAYCFFQQQRYAEAKQEYERVLEIDPNWIEARNDLGAVLLNTGESNEAEAEFRSVLTTDPNRVSAHANLAALLAKTGRKAEAMQELQIALRLDPEDASHHAALGDLMMQANRISEAAWEYQQAVGLRPDEAGFHFNFGNALARTNRLPEAIEQYREALRLDSASTELHANLGTALLESNRIDEAIAEYHAALRLDPDNTGIRNALGVALGKTGRFPEAAVQFEAVLKLDPTNARAIDGLNKIKTINPNP